MMRGGKSRHSLRRDGILGREEPEALTLEVLVEGENIVEMMLSAYDKTAAVCET
jgi:hypothetical protein